MIDANLELIKAELESLRLKRASVDAASLATTRHTRTASLHLAEDGKYWFNHDFITPFLID
jgi:hypothetical protein